MNRKVDQNVHAGHRKRLRDRAGAEGISGLEAHEALELLLFYCIPRRNVNQLAHRLIDRFGSLAGVLFAPEAELCAVSGVGTRAAGWLRRVGELARAYSAIEADDRPLLGNLSLARAFAASHEEVFSRDAVWQFCLTSEGRLLLERPLGPAGAWARSEAVAGALKDAIAVHAHSVILTQFIDRESVGLSEYDRTQTVAYGRRLLPAGVHLLDHILIGRGAFYSMQANGDLDELRFLAGPGGALGEHYLDATPLRRQTRLKEDEGAPVPAEPEE